MPDMDREPTVSVIIPAYNSERFIGQAIESVLGQTYSKVEVVVVNDGSTDSTAKIVQKFCGSGRLNYIEQHNKGVSSARNMGIRNSAGELIAFLDHDDCWFPKKLESQVAFILANPHIPWIHSNAHVDFNGSRRIVCWDAGVQGNSFKDLFARNRIILSTVLLRRDCLETVGLFNERFGGAEDYELWLRLAIRFPLGYIDEVLALYRVHDSNLSGDSFHMTDEDLRVIEAVVRTVPDIYRLLGRRAIKERIGTLAYELAGWHMWKSRNDQLAKQYLWKAIKKRPTHLASYKRFVWCSLSPEQRRTVLWNWHKVKKAVKAVRQLDLV
jgi:glycosyltransferase involved in cell wall biosynthesis